MGDKLVVDLAALVNASSALNTISTEFTNTDTVIHEVTASIGDKNETHNLRHAVERVSNSWDVRRAELSEDVSYLSRMAARVAEELGGVDQDLATQLTNSGSAGSNTSNSPRYI